VGSASQNKIADYCKSFFFNRKQAKCGSLFCYIEVDKVGNMVFAPLRLMIDRQRFDFHCMVSLSDQGFRRFDSRPRRHDGSHVRRGFCVSVTDCNFSMLFADSFFHRFSVLTIVRLYFCLAHSFCSHTDLAIV
jgi:hypothetical protein